jgi:hypothetical protein
LRSAWLSEKIYLEGSLPERQGLTS